jgi:hypothetical protein
LNDENWYSDLSHPYDLANVTDVVQYDRDMLRR